MSASSPCIRQCRIDDEHGLCAGCGRSLAEIAAWSALGEDERLAIMAGLPGRLAAVSGGAPPGRAGGRSPAPAP